MRGVLLRWRGWAVAQVLFLLFWAGGQARGAVPAQIDPDAQPSEVEADASEVEADAGDPDYEGEGEPADEDREAGDDQPVGEAHVVRYYLEEFEVLGNETTRRDVATRLMLVARGETFRADDPRIERSKAALLATGLFEDVRFSLRRGSRRGWVVFRIHVRERWTLLVDNLSFGYTHITPYGGLGLTEMNLLGTGSILGGAFVAGDQQHGYRLRFVDPHFLDTPYSLRVGALFNYAQDYLGFTKVTAVRPDGTVQTDHATVDYWRAGGTLGTGRIMSDTMRVDVAYRFEWIQADLPLSASYRRGGLTYPVPLDLAQGASTLSVVGVSYLYDSRDDPFLPSSGTRLRLTIDLSSDVFGSDYPYAKFAVDHATHFRLPWGHSVKVEVFGGLILGQAPLFEQFFIGDLSDLVPARVLDLNFHNYPSHAILGTAIAEMQYEDIATRVGAEYSLPLHRSRHGFLYGLDVFASFGLYLLASSEDLAVQMAGYDGAAAFPVDLTFDLGLRFDTIIGLFRLSFSNIIGMIPPGLKRE